MNLAPVVEQFGQEDQSWLASAHGLSAARSVTIDVTTLTEDIHYPNGYLPSGTPLAQLTVSELFAPYDPDTDEVQTVTITGAPTGGTFTLTFSGDTTGTIPFNGTAAEVLAALEALADVGVGNVTVTGSAGGPFTVTFVGDLASTNVAAMTATAGGLTGGTSPGVTIATTTAGGAASATDGQQTLVGFLFTSIEIVNRNGSVPAAVTGALLDHCKVHTSKLPFPVDAAGMAQVKGQIIFI